MHCVIKILHSSYYKMGGKGWPTGKELQTICSMLNWIICFNIHSLKVQGMVYKLSIV